MIKVVGEGYHQFVSSFFMCDNTRREPGAFGLLLQLCEPSIIYSILMFLEVFEFFSPLALLLLKVDGTIGLSD